jgi:hypothetical protein
VAAKDFLSNMPLPLPPLTYWARPGSKVSWLLLGCTWAAVCPLSSADLVFIKCLEDLQFAHPSSTGWAVLRLLGTTLQVSQMKTEMLFNI